MPEPARYPQLTAILRGIRPHEILDVAAVLVERGVHAIEVPLNSPEPLDSIARLQQAFGERCLCGAGTVLSVAQVDQVHATGARLVVAPNTDAAVIARALALGLVPMPGVASATEVFAAIAAGARELKLFPASSYGPGHLRALRAVLPAGVRVHAVGGVDAGNAATWREAGVDGFGLGGNLYKPGMSAAEVGARFDVFTAALAACATTNRGGA